MIFARQFAACCLLALFAAGCQSTYSEKNITTEPPPLLRSNSRVYVAIPFDAMFKKKVQINSGKQTAEAVFAAFSRYTKSVYIGKLPESPDEALESARKAQADYLVYPNLLKWEDHPTEWSGVRDQLELKIDLIETREGKLAFSRDFSATGKWMTEGGDTPNDLLPEPVGQFADALFRHVQKPSAL